MYYSMNLFNLLFLFSSGGTLETLMECSLQLILSTILIGFFVHLFLPFFFRFNIRTVTLFVRKLWLPVFADFFSKISKIVRLGRQRIRIYRSRISTKMYRIEFKIFKVERAVLKFIKKYIGRS